VTEGRTGESVRSDAIRDRVIAPAAHIAARADPPITVRELDERAVAALFADAESDAIHLRW